MIRHATMTQEAGSALLVDLPAELVLEVASQSPRQYGTCLGEWYATTEPRIAVLLNSSAAPGVPQIQPEEVDPFLALALNRMFVKYRLETLGAANGQVTDLGDCCRRMTELEKSHTVSIAPGKFMRWAGDALSASGLQLHLEPPLNSTGTFLCMDNNHSPMSALVSYRAHHL